MKLGRTFYHSWYLVVLGSLCPVIILQVKADNTTTLGWYRNTTHDDGSGEDEQYPGNFTSNIQMTGNRNISEDTQHTAQDNQIDDHQQVLPEDHFIWSKNDLTYAFEGQVLLGHVMVEYDNAYSVTQCSDRCMRHVPECKSYNYHADTHSCQLNSISDLEAPDDLRNMTGTTYYRTTAFQAHKSILGGCADAECLNDGRCLDLQTRDMETTAICSCPFEYGLGITCIGNPEITEWGAWADWGPCSVTCGEGWRRRHRQCNGQDDNHGELYCVGEAIETEVCVLDTCPYWEEWSDWAPCSSATTCGPGSQTKNRLCKHNGTPGVDRLCMGPLTGTKTCIEPGCAEAVRLTEYEVYGGGSVELYDNLHDLWGAACARDWDKEDADVICRQLGFLDGAAHAITNGSLPGPRGPLLLSSVNCSGDELNIQNCEHDGWTPLQCGTHPAAVLCIVDGVWGGWSPWSECSVTCADGIRTRTRVCDNPPPAYGGDFCPGEDTQHKDCTMIPCPVNGYWQPWQDWKHCNVSCGGGTQVRERVCVEPLHGGETCPGPSEETRDCNTHPCPVHCVWNLWSEWDSCTVTCGIGRQERTRTREDEKHGGEPCTGESSESKLCTPRECPVDGSWNQWEEWAVCSHSCGHGTRERKRTCNYGLHGGSNCTGPAIDNEHCFLKSCAIDGIWEEWTEWSACSVTCNNGTQVRNRTCAGPFYGGEPCPGAADEVKDCFPVHCPVDGVWFEWAEWQSCTVTCGGGTQERFRPCKQPEHGGLPCVGEPSQTRSCGEESCPVVRPWLEWGEWSQCTVSCGGGTRTRQRECLEEDLEGNYEEFCVGMNSTTEDCHEYNCLPIARTCGEWKDRGMVDNCYAEIDPKEKEEYTEVYCDMHAMGGTGLTLLLHNHMNRTKVDGFEGYGSFSLTLNYVLPFDEMKTIISLSKGCRQFVKWECHSAAMRNPYNDKSKGTSYITYWTNRDELQMNYWGGGDPDSSGCACDLDKSCVDPDFVCNCDKNDNVLREDSGYLTSKDDLPMFGFYAGDTGGDNEYGFVTLGAVECWGIDPDYNPEEDDNYDPYAFLFGNF